ITTFVSAILGYDKRKKILDPGILGVAKGYYGCVEAQGHGTLHCHMLVWIEGALDPQQIKDHILQDKYYSFQDRLLTFLDYDTIHTAIPPDPGPDVHCQSEHFHPCAVWCGPESAENTTEQIAKDLHILISKCQVHTHTGTCWKYFKGPGDPKPEDCHFDLSPKNANPRTYMDKNTGELIFHVTDGLVNNYNETMIQALQCNMDFKFIGSGPSAKAILYYVTDYITKSQLKTHVAYGALQAAVKKLQSQSQTNDSIALQAKCLLIRCANSLISKQELAAPQVASYLLGLKDYYTSHTFHSIYWTSFQAYINKLDPLNEDQPNTDSMEDDLNDEPPQLPAAIDN
ncbi:hypothetical protein BS47DRAFT_1248474, partial [Hydnum rufescens UP504]